MAFSNKLKETMVNREMRAADLARETGLSEAIISEYLSGKKEPRGKQSVLIARALRISLDELWETGFNGEEKAPASEQEPLISMEASNRLLVELGFIREGEQLSDDDLAFLTNVIGLLDNWFSRKGR